MADNKTQATADDVAAFLAASAHPADAATLSAMMTEVTGEPPVMWGPSIVGFGRYHYKYESGREGTRCRIGFSPRKAALVLYGTASALDRDALLAKLGKHTTGRGCVYVKRLADVDQAVLRALIASGFAASRANHPG